MHMNKENIEWENNFNLMFSKDFLVDKKIERGYVLFFFMISIKIICKERL